MVGPPLAGKGTQSRILSRELRIPHISSGDILRAEAEKGSLAARKIRETLSKGEFVPDEVVGRLLHERISELDGGGFILDGYPRTLSQLESIDFHYDRIIFLSTSLGTITERAKGRLLHPQSGRIYHTKFNPPKKEGVDDVTGEPLVPREDDKEEIVRHRYADFMTKTERVVEKGEALGKVAVINGDKKVMEVHTSILQALFGE